MLGEGCLRAMDCKAGLVKRQNLHLASCFQWLLSKLPQQWGSGGWNGATNKCILYVWVDATLTFWFAWVLHALIWRTSSRLVSFWADSFTTARCLGHCLAAMNGSSSAQFALPPPSCTKHQSRASPFVLRATWGQSELQDRKLQWWNAGGWSFDMLEWVGMRWELFSSGKIRRNRILGKDKHFARKRNCIDELSFWNEKEGVSGSLCKKGGFNLQGLGVSYLVFTFSFPGCSCIPWKLFVS